MSISEPAPIQPSVITKNRHEATAYVVLPACYILYISQPIVSIYFSRPLQNGTASISTNPPCTNFFDLLYHGELLFIIKIFHHCSTFFKSTPLNIQLYFVSPDFPCIRTIPVPTLPTPFSETPKPHFLYLGCTLEK